MIARAAIACVALIALAGCKCDQVRPATVVQTRDVPVTKYVRAGVPAQLTDHIPYAEPDRACWKDTRPVFCNGQIETMRQDYKHIVRRLYIKLDSIAAQYGAKGKP